MMDALAAMPKYDVYKDSGVSWLGIVPEKWKVIPAKRRHRVFKSINKRNQCDNVLSLTLRGVVNNNLENPEGLIPRDYASYQVFEKDDLVFKLIDLENLKTSRVGIVHERGIMSPAYIRMSVNENHCPKYAYYYFYDLYLNSVYNNLGEGVRSTLGPNDLLQIVVVEPSFDEQVAIANFLDRKLVQVDEAISIKEKQILLLKERKQIIIQKAVTQGLNPDVPMKYSGVDWIGQIPEHWTVTRVKHATKIISKGTTPSTIGREILEEGEIRFIKAENLVEGSITDRPLCFIDKKTNELLLRSSLKVGDVLFVIAGATLGKTAVVSEDIYPANTNQAVAFLRPNNLIEPTYLPLWLSSNFINQLIWLDAVQSAQPNLSMEDLGNFPLLIPPRTEQIDIIDKVADKTKKVDAVIALQMSQINTLKEYKAALINSAVTGKIKVT